MSSQPSTSLPVPAPAADAADRTTSTRSSSVASWLLTKDHKRIAMLYLIPVTLMFFIGGLAISINRLESLTPEGGLVERRHLQQALHGPRRDHGLLLPRAGDPGGAGQFLPADDDRRQGPGLSAAQPLSWYLYMFGRRLDAVSPCWPAGVDTGWTFYTPYSSEASHYNVALTMVGVVIAGFSSLLTGLNFIVTVIGSGPRA